MRCPQIVDQKTPVGDWRCLSREQPKPLTSMRGAGKTFPDEARVTHLDAHCVPLTT